MDGTGFCPQIFRQSQWPRDDWMTLDAKNWGSSRSSFISGVDLLELRVRALEAKLDRVTASSGTPWQLSADGCGGISELKSSFCGWKEHFLGPFWVGPKMAEVLDIHWQLWWRQTGNMVGCWMLLASKCVALTVGCFGPNPRSFFCCGVSDVSQPISRSVEGGTFNNPMDLFIMVPSGYLT